MNSAKEAVDHAFSLIRRYHQTGERPDPDSIMDAYIITEVDRRAVVAKLDAIRQLSEAGKESFHGRGEQDALSRRLVALQDEVALLREMVELLATHRDKRDYDEVAKGIRRLRVQARLNDEDREQAKTATKEWREHA